MNQEKDNEIIEKFFELLKFSFMEYKSGEWNSWRVERNFEVLKKQLLEEYNPMFKYKFISDIQDIFNEKTT